MFDEFISLVRNIYQTDRYIPLHEPRFSGNEKKYLLDTIDTSFVSSIGAYVDRLEADIAKFTGAQYTIATVNGTTALQIALLVIGVNPGDEVITQSLTFVATCNAISYCNAHPVFVDVERNHLGLSPVALEIYLQDNVEEKNGKAWNRTTKRYISACVPMHTFGHPADMDAILSICNRYSIPVVEDAAEAIGSLRREKHTGTFAKVGILSFNGNKIITTGGGGMIITDDEVLAEKCKHLSTTAKLHHKWEISHDMIGYNYRMPNLNAALGVAQLEKLPEFVEDKRNLAKQYQEWCDACGIKIIIEPVDSRSNYWLNAIVLNDRSERDAFLEYTYNNEIMTRPAWNPMHNLPMYSECPHGPLDNTEWLSERIVNIPSSARI